MLYYLSKILSGNIKMITCETMECFTFLYCDNGVDSSEIGNNVEQVENQATHLVLLSLK